MHFPSFPRRIKRLLLTGLFVACIVAIFHSISAPITITRVLNLKITKYGQVNNALIQLGLRPFTEDPSFSPVGESVTKGEYVHDEHPSWFVGSKLSHDQIKNYREDTFDCGKINYQSGPIKVSSPANLTDSTCYQDLWDYLRRTGYDQIAQSHKEDDWTAFSGSAVWMPRDNCYISVTRFLYAPGERDWPILSLCRMQAFDRDWHEIIGKRIRYVDVNETDVEKVLDGYLHGETVISKSAFDSISMRLPRFLNVPINYSKGDQKLYLGPEDAKITYRPNKFIDDEPIITFNMLTATKDRLMYAAFPLRAPIKDDEVIMTPLKYSGSLKGDNGIIEKNWSPFFDDDTGYSTSKSLGKAHILYSLVQFQVIECNLDTGICEPEFPIKEQSSIINNHRQPNLDTDYVFLRGGTNIVMIPEPLKKSLIRKENDQNVWFGFAKTHDVACTCGSMYRPVMFILMKKEGSYYLKSMSIASEFGIPVTPWTGGLVEHCDGHKNILSPNSIAFWNIDETSTGRFSDYMGMTFSMADSQDVQVSIKGMATYIKDIFDMGTEDSLPLERAEIVKLCALIGSNKHCEDYKTLHEDKVKSSDD